MDQEMYSAQCVVYSLHTACMGIYESCIHARKWNKKYLTVFCSMSNEVMNFSEGQLAIYREIESEVMPIMQTSIRYMKIYKNFVDDCFEYNYNCLYDPIDSDARSEELWNGINETKKALQKLNELVEVIQDTFQEFIKLVRCLNMH